MTISDWMMVLAVLAGPVIAVQLTRYLDEQREANGRKLWVFKTLMASRGIGGSQAHVEALNRIDLEFSPKKAKDKAVIEAWKAYLDFLNANTLEGEQWAIRRTDLLVELLHKMATGLKYEFDKTTIKNSIYTPNGHFQIEDDQTVIRQGVRRLLEGAGAFPMYVTNFPPTEAIPPERPISVRLGDLER